MQGLRSLSSRTGSHNRKAQQQSRQKGRRETAFFSPHDLPARSAARPAARLRGLTLAGAPLAVFVKGICDRVDSLKLARELRGS